MKRKIFFIALATFVFTSCSNKSESKLADRKTSLFCNDKCETKDKQGNLTCKLTTPELQKRKATVLTSLQKQILETKELENGYAFKFNGSDKTIDELTEFAKSERQCCDFFSFNISITGDTTSVWFEITGSKEAKEFIKTEMEL